MINRPRTINELNRRYDEVIKIAEKGLHNDRQAERFLSSVAHYINYAKNNKYTNDAIKKLRTDKLIKNKDKQLLGLADKIIQEMISDRDTVVDIAVKNGLDPNAASVPNSDQFSDYLKQLNNYVEADVQPVEELPGSILYLTQIIIDLVKDFGPNDKLEKIKSLNLKKRNEFEQSLKIHGVYLDYLRIEDYKILNWAWMKVYNQFDDHELLLFDLSYSFLFQSNASFSGGILGEAEEFLDEYSTSISRFHNHLVDKIEDTPLHEEFTSWMVAHFAPTFVSVLIIFIIFLITNWLSGGAVTYQFVQSILIR